MDRPADSLGYEADGWLFKTSRRAWGWHKAWLYETTPQGRSDVKAAMPKEAAELIKDAYARRSHGRR
jgi:hypothetical protein